MSVLVTVGSTSFDALIKKVNDPRFGEILSSQGLTRISIQYGRGSEEPRWRCDAMECKAFRFTPSLQSELESADLIVSHAGAGTVLEALALGKRLIVVVNDELMDNHQIELALQMQRDGHLYQTNCKNLLQDMLIFDWSKIQPLPQGNVMAFANKIESWIGISPS
eukprot:TRINITY_DN18869_c0_g1_i1.p1 TRINITY_DN18869_c0_g1~~TRINITY_DN18869_c0_g1_i1.p1  ORF type:complete len:165 (-),score=32.01 TRINITY_DN18869_c0_g1_i1:116-610(-)